MSSVTIQEAEFLTGLTRQAINHATKKGAISYTLNEKGVKVIDVSELQRSGYELIKTIEELEEFKQSGKKTKHVKSRKNKHVKDSSNAEVPVELLKQELESSKKFTENLEKERSRERALYEQQVETLTDSLKRAQETAQRVTLLLEDKPKDEGRGNEWQKAIKAMESRVANQEQESKDRNDREQKVLRQNQLLRKALQEEKSKGFFKKLFG